jgi:hypothetical protein
MIVAPATGSAWVSDWTPYAQADLAGTWNAEVWGGSPEGAQCWDNCTVSVASNGTVLSGGIYYDCFGGSSTILGGHLTMAPNGDITGTIEIDSETITIGPGAIYEEGSLMLSRQ